PGTYHMNSRFLRSAIIGAAQLLAIYAHHSFHHFCNRSHPALKALLQFLGRKQGKETAKGIMRGDAVREVQKGMEPVVLSFAIFFNLNPTVGSTDDSTDRDGNDIQ